MNISMEAFLTLILVSGFVRMLLALSILRYGLGLGAIEGGIIALVASAVLAITSLQASFPNTSIDALIEKAEKSEILKSDPIAGGQAASASPLNKALTHELRKGLEIGLILLLPFVILDLVSAHLLMLLGVTQIPASIIAIPLKFLLFLAVDGWTLLCGKLLT